LEASDLRRILYVEDEPDIQTVAKLALETLGRFEVATCSSGEEALREAPRFRPDLVLLDVMMPGLDGPATLRALRAVPELAPIPAIFMTAKVQPHEVAELKQLGAIYVIAKPFDPMTLADQIRELWRQWHER
jgi:CheY-like chemotaxis protein